MLDPRPKQLVSKSSKEIAVWQGRHRTLARSPWPVRDGVRRMKAQDFGHASVDAGLAEIVGLTHWPC